MSKKEIVESPYQAPGDLEMLPAGHTCDAPTDLPQCRCSSARPQCCRRAAKATGPPSPAAVRVVPLALAHWGLAGCGLWRQLVALQLAAMLCASALRLNRRAVACHTPALAAVKQMHESATVGRTGSRGLVLNSGARYLAVYI